MKLCDVYLNLNRKKRHGYVLDVEVLEVVVVEKFVILKDLNEVSDELKVKMKRRL